MLQQWLNAEIDYPTFTQREIDLLHGIQPAAIEQTLQQIKITDSAKMFLDDLQNKSYPAYIISTGIYSVIERELADYPAIKIYANKFCPSTLTADISVSGDMCPTKGKRAIITDLLTNYPQHESWAIGDSDHDEEMFKICDKPILRKEGQELEFNRLLSH